MIAAPTFLVVAKAPVPGSVKTRLMPAISADEAADVAAAALLDTLDAVVSAASSRPAVVALTGNLRDAVRREALRASLARFVVVPQHGSTFADRLVAAHADAAAVSNGGSKQSGGVVQVGMDTPQVRARQLADATRALGDPAVDAVLGPALDGGWWLLGVSDPRWAEPLAEVAMSRDDTAAKTRSAIEGRGARLRMVPPLRDVDSWADATAVAATCPGGRFARSVRALGARELAS